MESGRQKKTIGTISEPIRRPCSDQSLKMMPPRVVDAERTPPEKRNKKNKKGRNQKGRHLWRNSCKPQTIQNRIKSQTN